MNIKEKLSAIQGALKAPKNQYNKFGGYNYRSCEDIIEAVKPLCREYNCVLVVGDSLTHVGERYYIQATAVLADCESEESLRNVALAREDESQKGMSSGQLTGATSTYARKYALNGLFCIDDTKDLDSEEHQKQRAKNENRTAETKENRTEETFEVRQINKTELGNLTAVIDNLGKDKRAICDYYKIADLPAMSTEQYADCVKVLGKQAGTKTVSEVAK